MLVDYGSLLPLLGKSMGGYFTKISISNTKICFFDFFRYLYLFAGKMHALVYRAWKNRVKGRDWYDFEWYVRHNVPLDFAHLSERCKQFNNEEIAPELFKAKLKERLATADIKQVKADVLPFVRNPKELDIWSNDYFVQLADMVRIE